MGNKEDEGFQDGAHISVLSSYLSIGPLTEIGKTKVKWTFLDAGSNRLVLSMFNLRCSEIY